MLPMAKLTFTMQVHVEDDDGSRADVTYQSHPDSLIEVESTAPGKLARMLAGSREALFGVIMVGQKVAIPMVPSGDVQAKADLEPQRLVETSVVPPPKGAWARDPMRLGFYSFACPNCGSVRGLDSGKANFVRNEDGSRTIAEMFKCPQCRTSCQLTLAAAPADDQ